MKFSNFLIVFSIIFQKIQGKYVEGELKTNDNWAFLARFCFLSDDGQFEYYIEFNENQGTPNLLLYYDTDDQWPAVYKSNKNCYEREQVLHIEQNQIVNLSTADYLAELSGCSYMPVTTTSTSTTTVKPKTTTKPKQTYKNTKRKQTTTKTKVTERPLSFSSGTARVPSTSTIAPPTITNTTATPTNTNTTNTLATTTNTTTPTPTNTTTAPTTTNSTNSTSTNSTSTKTTASTTSISNTNRVPPMTGTEINKPPTPTLSLPFSPLTTITSTATRTNPTTSTPLNKLTKPTTPNQNNSPIEDFRYTTTPTQDNLNEYELISQTDSKFLKPIKKRSLLQANFTRKMIRNRMISCHNARRFRSSRERWWFIAVSNCDGSKGINIKYRLLMTNGEIGDYWHEHFSADEFYILPILMAFFISYSFLILAIIICSMELKTRHLLHTTYKIFCLSVFFQLFGILLQSITYLKYAVNGLKATKLHRMGAIYMGASEVCFLLLLLLLAKGYTITRGRLPVNSSIKLTIFMCLYVVTYITLFIYEAQVFDPGEVLYIYESPAGYGLISLRIIAWFMFIYSTIFTLKRYPEKSNFYYPFNIFGTLWFIAGPAFILSANSYIDKWVRESVVCAVLQLITFGGHLMFLILTMPSVANKNFPYHVRTTQIGIMELHNSNAIEQFNHHNYEPSGNYREPQTVIIPLTRRTEEIFEGMYNHQPIISHQRAQNNSRGGNDVIDNNNLNNNRENMAMENVLNWSLAKNIQAVDSNAYRKRSDDLSSRGSVTSGDYSNSSRRTSTTANNNNNNNHSSENGVTVGHFQDYVREVPLELFTISRMVVATKNENQGDVK